jgi:hypothetical protein
MLTSTRLLPTASRLTGRYSITPPAGTVHPERW